MRTLREGDRGADVMALQQQLTGHGFPCQATGVFGPGTLARVRAFQGVRGLAVDGIAGPRTQAALAVDPDTRGDVPAGLDVRSLRNLETLLSPAKDAALVFVRAAAGAGESIQIISGTRSYAEQNAIYAQGRDGNGGKIVTNARAGYSAHNFGIAFDIGIFQGGQYLDDLRGVPAAEVERRYNALGIIGERCGLAWGGRWGDAPHYAKRPAWGRDMGESEFIAALRDRHARGVDVYA